MLLTTAFLACAAVSPALSGPLVDWDPAMFWEPGANPIRSLPGGQMQIVGTVSSFGGPLASLNATMPATQYTLYVSGLVSTGTDSTFIPFYFTNYNGGQIEIWADAGTTTISEPFDPPGSTVPANFIDGTMILQGTMSLFNTQTNTITPHRIGNAEGHIAWTGGTLVGLVNDCPALFTGGLTWFADPSILWPGYLFRHDGKIDYECPTPTRTGSWGRIKTLYR